MHWDLVLVETFKLIFLLMLSKYLVMFQTQIEVIHSISIYWKTIGVRHLIHKLKPRNSYYCSSRTMDCYQEYLICEMRLQFYLKTQTVVRMEIY
jgi:hypothetical protein